MSSIISKRDLKNLSAYLDNQLTDKQVKNLETRLFNDLELQKALNDMRTTKKILNVTPELKAPKNFILFPAIIEKLKMNYRIHGAMRLTSALASVFFVLVFVGDIIFFNSLGQSFSIAQSEVETLDRAVVAEDESVGGIEEFIPAMTEKIEEPPPPSNEPATFSSDEDQHDDLESSEDNSGANEFESDSAVAESGNDTSENISSPPEDQDSGKQSDETLEEDVSNNELEISAQDEYVDSSENDKENWLVENLRYIEIGFVLIALISWISTKVFERRL